MSLRGTVLSRLYLMPEETTAKDFVIVPQISLIVVMNERVYPRVVIGMRVSIAVP